jgi:hypothetical protein
MDCDYAFTFGRVVKMSWIHVARVYIGNAVINAYEDSDGFTEYEVMTKEGTTICWCGSFIKAKEEAYKI